MVTPGTTHLRGQKREACLERREATQGLQIERQDGAEADQHTKVDDGNDDSDAVIARLQDRYLEQRIFKIKLSAHKDGNDHQANHNETCSHGGIRSRREGGEPVEQAYQTDR